MRRTEQAQGLRLMKFGEVYGRTARSRRAALLRSPIPVMTDISSVARRGRVG